MLTRYQKDRPKAAMKRKVVSPTMNKIRPISKGGTKIVSELDRTLAILEMNWQLRRTQRLLNGKANREWRASPNVYI